MLLARLLSYSSSYWANKRLQTRLRVHRSHEAAWGRKFKVYTPDFPDKQSRNEVLSCGKGRETRVLANGPNDVVGPLV